MPYRLLGLPEELRLEIEQASGEDTEQARVIIEYAVQQTQSIIDASLKELQSLIGPHGTISRLQSGGIRISPGMGLSYYADGVQKTSILPNGDFAVGSDITSPTTSTVICFVEDEIYNGESMGAGDLLFGDNSTASSNVKFDASEGQLQFRYGTTTKAYMDTDGAIKAGSGAVVFDQNGITFEQGTVAVGTSDPSMISWEDTGGDITGWIQDTNAAGTESLYIQKIRQTGTSGGATDLWVELYNQDRSEYATINLHGTDSTTYATFTVGNNKISMNLDSTLINNNAENIDFRVLGDTEQYAIFVDASADTVYLGGQTNAVKIAKGGEITLEGTATRFDDLRVEPTARTTGANAPTFEKWLDDSAGTSRGVYLYSFDDAAGGSEKEVFFTMQLPHSWKEGSAINIHVHWIGNVDDTTADVRWGLEYAWKDIGQVFGDTTIVYTGGTHIDGSGSPDANITALKHYISAFSAITPDTTQNNLSSVLIGRLFRDSADAGDTYNAATNKAGLLYIDAHYEIDSLGSSAEYVK